MIYFQNPNPPECLKSELPLFSLPQCVRTKLRQQKQQETSLHTHERVRGDVIAPLVGCHGAAAALQMREDVEAANATPHLPLELAISFVRSSRLFAVSLETFHR